MAPPKQIAVFPIDGHDGRNPLAGSHPIEILDVGADVDGVYTVAGANVSAGALVVPIVPQTTIVMATSFAVENTGQNAVITIPDTWPDGQEISLEVSGTIYTTDYQGIRLTAGVLRAGSVCLEKIALVGGTTLGETLTATPGKWIYVGEDPGDQTFQFVRGTGEAILGATGLTYTTKSPDVGNTISIEETFDGVTIASDPTATITSSSLVVANGDFETGDLTGWTITSGAPRARSDWPGTDYTDPLGGSWTVDGGVNASSAMYQDLDLTEFDLTGLTQYEVNAILLQNDPGTPDAVELFIELLDAEQSVLVSMSRTKNSNPPKQEAVTLTLPPTANAETLRIRLVFTKGPLGSSIQAGADNITVTLVY